MLRSFEVCVGEGKYTLKAIVIKTQEGMDIYIGGGEKTHIGTTVISQPRPSLLDDGSISCTTSIFNILGHKDDEIATPIAERICKKINQVVVVTAGIHIDNPNFDEIRKLKNLGKELTLLVLEGLERYCKF